MQKSDWIPNIANKPKVIPSHSWFNILEHKNPDYNATRTTVVTDKKLTKIKKIKLYPNKQQREILQKWIELSRQMYNKTVQYLNIKIFDEEGHPVWSEVKKYLNAIKLRDVYLKDEKAKLVKDDISTYMLNEAIKRCVAMFQSSLTKYKNDPKKKPFEMRIIKKDKRYKWLMMIACAFSTTQNAFCVRVLDSMKSESEIKGLKRSTTIIYDKYRSTYTLLVPEDVQPVENRTKNSFVGIDGGIRTFLTLYSKDACYEICNNHNFEKYYNKIDELNSNFSEAIDKQCRKYKKCIGRIYDKISNKVRDMHFKAAHFICKNFKNVNLGKLSTAQIARNETSVLSNKTKRVAYSLSHYRFRIKLEYMCQKYDVDLDIVSEYMTTKTCSKCGKIKRDIGTNKVYKCDNVKCKLIADRDINAAKNIRYVEL